uniref:Uncharacterized protein n=1 Tax=Caenorhabditis japonica TaxID=281687 RepID=A0A8R1IRH6_CAEJA
MAPPSRKKKPKGTESPPTDDIQVVDFAGRHTEASRESGPVSHTAASDASDIRQQPDIELDSDYDIEIDVSDQEEY